MQKILRLMLFLIVGLIASQLLPSFMNLNSGGLSFVKNLITMGLLSYIMIEVGIEFEIEKGKKASYTTDYLAAAMAAGFPWIFVSIYFYFFLMPDPEVLTRPGWIEALLVGRFAAPTSAGVLFTMLVAAGLSDQWVFKKAKILAIFDDLDTVLLMIPLQILMVGFVWQLFGVIAALAIMMIVGFFYYKKLKIKTTWYHLLGYGFLLTIISETVYYFTKSQETGVGLHIEILLPAFILGCMIKKDHSAHEEGRASEIISCIFLFMVGLSMPLMLGAGFNLSSADLIFHVLVVTIISNIGKMFVFFCYKKEATIKERLALAVAMFPRGEVGAGVLALAVGYGIKGPFMQVAFLSLALNLILTGGFIYCVKKLIAK